jgi:hypothetical protein
MESDSDSTFYHILIRIRIRIQIRIFSNTVYKMNVIDLDFYSDIYSSQLKMYIIIFNIIE